MNAFLDLRHLPAPEPMRVILERLATLSQAGQLVVMTPFEPLPLLALLEERGFDWHSSPCRDHGFRVVIRRLRHQDVAMSP